jgi:multiple sugar transport system permease protein
MIIGFGIALLLNKKLKFRGLMQTLFLVPIVISPTVVALLWQLLYSQEGVIDYIVIPLLGHRIAWLSDPSVALWSIIIPDIWQWTPMVVLVMLAGLQAVPDHMKEAAIMDGANRRQRFIDITLPYLKNLIVLLLILRIIGAIRVFAKVFVLTRGGPGGATNVVSMELYRQAFRFTSFGKASAMALVLMAIVLVIAVIFSQVADIEF